VPVFTSPGRAGFGPQLTLHCSTCNGNGSFGLGWSLSIQMHNLTNPEEREPAMVASNKMKLIFDGTMMLSSR